MRFSHPQYLTQRILRKLPTEDLDTKDHIAEQKQNSADTECVESAIQAPQGSTGTRGGCEQQRITKRGPDQRFQGSIDFERLL